MFIWYNVFGRDKKYKIKFHIQWITGGEQMQYKLLCTDMDGTLLTSDKKITERTKRAIELAHERGVKIAVSTGRMFNSAYYYADLIGVKAPVISANGAFIREKDRDKVIYKSNLGYDNCKRIVEVLEKYGICPHFHTPNSIFSGDLVHSSKIYSELNKYLPTDCKIAINIVDEWDKVFRDNEEDIVKCIGVDDDIEKVKKAKEELLAVEGIEVVSSYSNNFEIMARGVSKGKGVELLAGFYGLTPEEIICVGDNENDISMIEYAGLGVAMGNAEDEVKAIAQFVTETNDCDGVAKVIEKFILESK